MKNVKLPFDPTRVLRAVEAVDLPDGIEGDLDQLAERMRAWAEREMRRTDPMRQIVLLRGHVPGQENAAGARGWMRLIYGFTSTPAWATAARVLALTVDAELVAVATEAWLANLPQDSPLLAQAARDGVKSLAERTDVLQVYVEHTDGTATVTQGIGGRPVSGPAADLFTWPVTGRRVGSERERTVASDALSFAARWYPLLGERAS